MGGGSAGGLAAAPCQQQLSDNVHKFQQCLPCNTSQSLEMGAKSHNFLTWNHISREFGEIDMVQSHHTSLGVLL